MAPNTEPRTPSPEHRGPAPLTPRSETEAHDRLGRVFVPVSDAPIPPLSSAWAPHSRGRPWGSRNAEPSREQARPAKLRAVDGGVRHIRLVSLRAANCSTKDHQLSPSICASILR